MLGGDDRCPVLKRGPGPARQVAVGLGQDLAAHAEIGRRDETGERALRREGGEGLRAVPGQGAAERAPAAAQAHGNQRIAAGGEPRAGEAQQQAAGFDEGPDAGGGAVVHGADIGKHQHRHLVVEQLRDRIGDALGAARLLHVGEGRERTGKVVGRREQRLGLIVGAAEDETDPSTLAALVHQRDGTGRALAGDLDAADAVAQFDRHVEGDIGLRGVRREGEVALGERQPFLVEGPHEAGIAAVRGRAQHARGELAGNLRGGQRHRRRGVGAQDRQRGTR